MSTNEMIVIDKGHVLSDELWPLFLVRRRDTVSNQQPARLSCFSVGVWVRQDADILSVRVASLFALAPSWLRLLCVSHQATPWLSPTWQAWWWAPPWRTQLTASLLRRRPGASPPSMCAHLATLRAIERSHKPRIKLTNNCTQTGENYMKFLISGRSRVDRWSRSSCRGREDVCKEHWGGPCFNLQTSKWGKKNWISHVGKKKNYICPLHHPPAEGSAACRVAGLCYDEPLSWMWAVRLESGELLQEKWLYACWCQEASWRLFHCEVQWGSTAGDEGEHCCRSLMFHVTLSS